MHTEMRELDKADMGKRIRAVREDKKMTREALAEKVDVSVNFIADIEFGKKCPSIKKFHLICQVLDVTADYLLSGKVYALDFDQEAVETYGKIMELLGSLNQNQLKSIRDISMIYADSLKK